MKNIILLSLLGLIIFTTPIFSQKLDTISTSQSKHYKNYLGANIGATTGIGFSYRYMPDKQGVQVTFLPIYDSNYTYISFGISYLKEIKGNEYSRFLFYAGNHITNFFNYEVTDNIGFGIGFDFFYEDFLINFMIGYGGYDIFNDFKTRPAGEVGIFYNF